MKSPARPVLPPAPSRPSGPVPASRFVRGALALVLIFAAGVRLWRLDRVPGGAWIDECIEGLQAAALLHGERLPATPKIPFPRWPVWCAAEAVATRLGGETLGVLRLPAALAGLAAVGTAFLAGRALLGPVAGLGAAAFLAASFWHVQYSRMALPCGLAVTEGLLLAWWLLRAEAPGALALLATALVSVAALWGYAASLVTPALAALLLTARFLGQREFRPTRNGLIGAGIVGLAAGALLLMRRPESLSRTAELAGAAARAGLVDSITGWLASVGWSTAKGWGYWRSYPVGSARLTPLELGCVLAGAAALAFGGGLARWQRRALAGWALLAVLPEWGSGDAPHLVQGLPQLAPLALAAGAGIAWLAGRGKAGPWLAAAVLVAGAGLTARRLEAFATDPLVGRWYLTSDRDAADDLLARARSGPIRLTPAFSYALSPVILYPLDDAVRRGAIELTNDRTRGLTRRAVFVDPVTREPASILVEADRPVNGRRHYWLIYMAALLERGNRALADGDLRTALREFTAIVRDLPNAPGARAGLGLTLFRLGRLAEAEPHLVFAMGCSPEPDEAAILEDALARIRAARSAGPR